MRTRIKICGIKRPEDARLAVQAGVDAIGLMFYRSSPRAIKIGVAAEISHDLPALVAVVAVFVDSHPREVEKILSNVNVSLLQFHGNESADECEQFGMPYIKAARMRDGLEPQRVAEAHPNARAILLDAYHETKYGGTGESFAWERVSECETKPVILAGGLTPENVSEAVMVTSAYGIDVSSGVETSPGIKDGKKINDLVALVRGCDQILSMSSDEDRGL